VFCSPPRLAGVIAVLALMPAACGRRSAGPQIERLAVLRFENLGQDPSADWMGRAFSEIITDELSTAADVYAIPISRLLAYNQTLGVRPISAPGISGEWAMALAAGANRIGYGEYSVRGGRLEARLSIEDQRSGKTTRVLSSSAAAGDVIAAATGLARQVSDRAQPYGTRNPQAVQAWVAAEESAAPEAARQAAEQALAADPDFAAPYRGLAQWKAKRGDPAGAQALLAQGLARGGRISAIERARMEEGLAEIRRDASGRQRALAAMLELDPLDPVAWRSLADTAVNRHEYTAAVQAYLRSLEIEPDDLNARNQLGYAAAWAGDLETAVRALRAYQALRPTDANPLDSLGDVNLITGHLREAEGFYLEAVKKDPNFLNHIEYFKAAMARLMTGDVAGADALANQYINLRAGVHDPALGYYRAEWSSISGRRTAYQELLAVAESHAGSADAASRDLASRAYAELAIAHLMRGDRASAAQRAQESARLAGPSSAGLSLIARFLAQPSGSPAEWAARADRLFGNAAQSPLRDLTLGYALLLDKQFQAASGALKRAWEASGPSTDTNAGILLAWALLEGGRVQEAAPLLRSNPVPPSSGMGPMMSFWFPRIFQLRGLLAEKQGKPGEARSNYQIFQKLSGGQ